MNTGQGLLTIAAMMLLSILILRVNNTFLTTGSVLVDSKFGIIATSLATSQLEKINTLAFDNYTASNSTHNLSDLTSPGSLGPESGETADSLYNDIDDYNGWYKNVPVVIDSSKPAENFRISCQVCYVNPTNPDGYSNVATWNKKIKVTVSNQFMPDTVKMSTIYSYWVFR